ncbi:hypothetical protein D3C87_2129070 [compost metagenome]
MDMKAEVSGLPSLVTRRVLRETMADRRMARSHAVAAIGTAILPLFKAETLE